MRAKDFRPASKPRNFVAKNSKTAGAGAHKDKKRADKQGDVKHKQKQFEQGVAEGDVDEAPDSKFVGFMNQALGKKVDEPSKKSKSGIDDYDNAPTMNLDSYKPALDFCMKIIQKLNPTQKTKLSTKGEHGVVRWLTKQATDAGLVPNKFVEEDIDEVQEQLPEIFKDPAITSWALVLTDGEPLPKPPSKGPFTVIMNQGLPPPAQGYANSDWVDVDTLDNLPDAEEIFKGIVSKNPKYYVGITDATGKWGKFYDPSKKKG